MTEAVNTFALFYRMFRGPKILTRSCPIRSLLLVKESHFSAVSEHTGAGWQPARAVKERRYERLHGSKESSSLSCSTQLSLFSLDCDNQQMRVASFQNLLSEAVLSSRHHPPQVSTSARAKRESDSWKCTVVEDLGQNLKAVSAYPDCLINKTCLQPRRRPWDSHQPSFSFTNKTLCSLPQSHLYYRQHFVRPFSLLTHRSWIFNHFHSRPQPSSHSFHPTRAAHQAAPRVAGAWSDCLSPENESRCRQSLGPNLKLYEVDKERKGVSQSKGKNQPKWASVLVCLCSVEGEPAFLFTLRSSTLKGRHKGDVR